MAYVHVVTIALLVIMSLWPTMHPAGHVEVGDYANFGGYAGVPQFHKIGAYTHCGDGVMKDAGLYDRFRNPAYAFGMNTEGMKRQGDNETIEQLKQAYRTVYRKGLRVQEALDA